MVCDLGVRGWCRGLQEVGERCVGVDLSACFSGCGQLVRLERSPGEVPEVEVNGKM